MFEFEYRIVRYGDLVQVQVRSAGQTTWVVSETFDTVDEARAHLQQRRRRERESTEAWRRLREEEGKVIAEFDSRYEELDPGTLDARREERVAP